MQRGHRPFAPDFRGRESQSFVTLTNYDSRGLIAMKPDQFFPVPLQACSVLDEIELRSGNRLARDGRIESMILDTRTIPREIETCQR